MKMNESVAVDIKGDAIGNTAYSERFVLKILIKFANLDSLKLEMEEKSFEEDLCTLWDMSAENDVVKFLLANKFYNLVTFCIDSIENKRILEVIVGIVANTCCNNEAVLHMQEDRRLMTTILNYIHSDDSLLLIQIIRTVNACLYQVQGDNLHIWLDMLKEAEFHNAIEFILKNSTNSNLLNVALEFLNTAGSKFSNDKCRITFHEMFISEKIVEAFNTGYFEIFGQHEGIERMEWERILLISLQINLVFLGYKDSLHVFEKCKDDSVKMFESINSYYSNQVIENGVIDEDMCDIIESTQNFLVELNMFSSESAFKIFNMFYDLWKCLKVKEAIPEVSANALLEKIKTFICEYMMLQDEKKIEEIKLVMKSDYDFFIKKAGGDIK